VRVRLSIAREHQSQSNKQKILSISAAAVLGHACGLLNGVTQGNRIVAMRCYSGLFKYDNMKRQTARGADSMWYLTEKNLS
jgi:GTP cyclohydrolase I